MKFIYIYICMGQKILFKFICCFLYIIDGYIDRSAYSGFELNKNRFIYKYVPLYHVQFRSQCIKQPMNQFSNTQRSVTEAGYDKI
jgi:hypothetical protein